MRLTTFTLCVALGCTSSSEPPSTPESAAPPAPTPAVPPPPTEPANDAPEPKPSERPADPATPEGLANLLIDDGGVGWVAASSRAVALESWREEGTGAGLQAVIVHEAGKRETVDLCKPGDCEQADGARDAAHAKKLAEELRKRSLSGGVMMQMAEWPRDANDYEIAPLEGKLVWKRTHLQLVRKGKPPQTLRTLKVSPPHKAVPREVYFTSDKNVIAVRFDFDPGSKYGQHNVFEEVHVYLVH